MDLTQEQRALADSVADLIRRHPPDSGSPGEFWRLLAGIGVAGLAIPERFGGAGAGILETAIVAEQLGRALAPSPLLGSAVLAAQAILASGDADACSRLLPPIAEGTLVAALAWTGREGGWDPGEAGCFAVERSGGGWTLTGAAHYVLDGDSADVLIVAAGLPEGGIGLFEVSPDQAGVEREAVAAVDQTRRLAVVRLAAAARQPLGTPDEAGSGAAALTCARDAACLVLAAEQAGAAARALELTVEYTKARVQFGRPIASFQAIQHRLAELHALVASARSLAYRAAAASPGEVTLLAPAAKTYCSDVLSKVAAEAIQLHGAIGITWEHPAQRYFKRAHGSAQLFGSPAAQLARIADLVIG
ncbi:MAG TPA: acyl-CoA dehydrogenase family protein [Streptosporangiaceae bacterium]|nr:acyl-CoA dehydrogenase family protein [Streptosporangiaceae bacterium]